MKRKILCLYHERSQKIYPLLDKVKKSFSLRVYLPVHKLRYPLYRKDIKKLSDIADKAYSLNSILECQIDSSYITEIIEGLKL